MMQKKLLLLTALLFSGSHIYSAADSTELINACFEGDESEVQRLIESCAEVNQARQDGVTPLFLQHTMDIKK